MKVKKKPRKQDVTSLIECSRDDVLFKFASPWFPQLKACEILPLDEYIERTGNAKNANLYLSLRTHSCSESYCNDVNDVSGSITKSCWTESKQVNKVKCVFRCVSPLGYSAVWSIMCVCETSQQMVSRATFEQRGCDREAFTGTLTTNVNYPVSNLIITSWIWITPLSPAPVFFPASRTDLQHNGVSFSEILSEGRRHEGTLIALVCHPHVSWCFQSKLPWMTRDGGFIYFFKRCF